MERFKNRKPNKKDHQKIQNAAKGAKNSVALLTAVVVAGRLIKKHGKSIAKVASKLILKH